MFQFSQERLSKCSFTAFDLEIPSVSIKSASLTSSFTQHIAASAPENSSDRDPFVRFSDQISTVFFYLQCDRFPQQCKTGSGTRLFSSSQTSGNQLQHDVRFQSASSARENSDIFTPVIKESCVYPIRVFCRLQDSYRCPASIQVSAGESCFSTSSQ